MRDAAIPMRDWTRAYRTPYWNHNAAVDWSGAAHGFAVPLERVLFAPLQWLFAREVHQCCVGLNCLDRDVTRHLDSTRGMGCTVRRHEPEPSSVAP